LHRHQLGHLPPCARLPGRLSLSSSLHGRCPAPSRPSVRPWPSARARPARVPNHRVLRCLPVFPAKLSRISHASLSGSERLVFFPLRSVMVTASRETPCVELGSLHSGAFPLAKIVFARCRRLVRAPPESRPSVHLLAMALATVALLWFSLGRAPQLALQRRAAQLGPTAWSSSSSPPPASLRKLPCAQLLACWRRPSSVTPYNSRHSSQPALGLSSAVRLWMREPAPQVPCVAFCSSEREFASRPCSPC
jgi:hypothetical protein